MLVLFVHLQILYGAWVMWTTVIFVLLSLFLIFQRFIIFILCVCVLLVACTYHALCSCLVPQKAEESVGSPEELHKTVLATVWVLGTEPELSARAASALNLQALSLAPLMHSFKHYFFLKRSLSIAIHNPKFVSFFKSRYPTSHENLYISPGATLPLRCACLHSWP